ncbi:hypothetical protein [Alienimonas sp. DA493]|uniref:hypothetical protein n=1 Tax=Alienimonas sp. DA493 TaxID=3373605 RepID=UPI0037544C5C
MIEPGGDAEAPRDRAGLALSGGRAGAAGFNLGFVQGLGRRGLLRQFDYLSLVAGGGRVGALLTAVAGRPDNDLGLTAGGDPTREPVEAPVGEPGRLLPSADGRQPPQVLKLTHAGVYLRQGLRLFDRYLLGVLVTNLLIILGLCAAAAGVAWAFRAVDGGTRPDGTLPWTAGLANAFGFNGDVRRAFFWSSLLLTLWIAAWCVRLGVAAVSRIRAADKSGGGGAPDGPPRWAVARRLGEAVRRVLLVLWLVGLPLGLVSLLATGDISIASHKAADAEDRTFLRTLTEGIAVVLAAFQVVTLLGALLPSKMLHGGTHPQDLKERWFYRVASMGMLIGGPLLLFGVFAREDLTDLTRRPDEVRPDVPLLCPAHPHLISGSDFNTFPIAWRRIHQLADRRLAAGGRVKANVPVQAGGAEETEIVEEGLFEPAHAMWFSASRPARGDAVKRAAAGGWDGEAAELVEAEVDRVEHLYGLFPWERPLPQSLSAWMRSSVPVEDAASWETHASSLYRQTRQRLTERRAMMAGLALHALSDPKFYEKFRAFDLQTDVGDELPLGCDPPRIVAARERAEGLARRWGLPRDKGGWPEYLTVGPDRRNELLAALESDRADGGSADRVRLLRETQEVNAELVRAYLGELIGPADRVFAAEVHAFDQAARLRLAAAFAIAAVLVWWLVNLNDVSTHGTLRDAFRNVWLPNRRDDPRLTDLAAVGPAASGSGPDQGSGGVPPRTGPPTLLGGPYPLISGTAHLPHRCDLVSGMEADAYHRRLERPRPGRQRPAGVWALRPFERFLLSPLYCGGPRTGWVRTDGDPDYRSLRLSDAACLAAGVLTPERTRDWALRALTTLFNVRLGLRVRNPARVSSATRARSATRAGRTWARLTLRRRPPRALWQFVDYVTRHPEDRENLLLTDGQHHDSLGLEALLRRRTRLIVCVDAAADPDGRFADLLKTVQREAAESGVRVRYDGDGGEELCRESLERVGSKDAAAHFLTARITYPPLNDDPALADLEDGPAADAANVTEGYLIYVRPTFDGDEPAALQRFRSENPAFPNDPAAVVADPRLMEAYRSLGQHAAEVFADRLDRLGGGRPGSSAGDRRSAWLASFDAAGLDDIDPRTELPTVRFDAEGGSGPGADGCPFSSVTEAAAEISAARTSRRRLAVWRIISADPLHIRPADRRSLSRLLAQQQLRETDPGVHGDLLRAIDHLRGAHWLENLRNTVGDAADVNPPDGVGADGPPLIGSAASPGPPRATRRDSRDAKPR